MVVPDLGELAYGSGDADVLSQGVATLLPGEAAALPMCCAPET